ncbi:SpoIIE family protein phosphatase [Streptomyces sp. 7R007]
MRSVVGQMFLLQVTMTVLLAVTAVVVLVLAAQRQATEAATNRSRNVAEAIARAPGTADALASTNATAVLQPYAARSGGFDKVGFVVIIDSHGYRVADTDPHMIGRRVTVRADLDALHTGRTVTGRVSGDGHQVIRAFTPVRDDRGRVVGGVVVGVTVSSVSAAAMAQVPAVVGVSAGAVVISTIGALLVGRRLLRMTRGLGPAEITRLYNQHDAVLRAAREGVVIVDARRRLLLANEEARRLLELPDEAQGRRVDELGLAAPMAELLASGREATDEVHLSGGRVLAVNQRLLEPYGATSGSVATLRDSTELRHLSGRAEAARERLRLLYDAGLGIGTTLDVTRTAQELAEVAVPQFCDYVTVDLAEPVLGGDEPTGRERTLRRVAIAGIGDAPFTPVGADVTFVTAMARARDMTQGRGAIDPDLRVLPGLVPGYVPGFGPKDGERAAGIVEHGVHSLITVPLSARGVVLGVAGFWRSKKPEPFEEDDLALAEEMAARAAVAIDNSRRYTREHAMAVTLQRSLLPASLPAPTALEVAYRYLPAESSDVSGDWFDVIPLPGARVALVVGDIVGHGLHAAATMGRLRTAVHTLAALDLSPSELMAHLDDLVTRIDTDEADGDEGPDVTGATCLYAVYDPASGRAAMARAGHPGPAVVRPDGTVEFPHVPVSPPLGLGGTEPVETAELALGEGSRLVLFTDGLVEARGRDIDAGLELLRDALTGHPERDPEATCQAVLESVLPARPSDDVALLVARTRCMDPGHIATWNLASDPAAIAPVRAACTRWLTERGLDSVSYATELIVSELATNAVRYGTQPITVRLLYDQTLICEVSDASSTSPHLRRAATTDEGGRGLYLVARFAQRWGTRYTSGGKVIWTEQALHDRDDKEPGGDTAEALLEQWTDL